MENDSIKLTKLAKCAGCGAKVGAGVLARLLDGIRVHEDANLLVGFDRSDDASVYKISDELALVQTVDFSRPSPTTRIPSARSSRQTPCPTSTQWAASRSSA